METIKNTLMTYAVPVYTEEFVRQKPSEVQVNISGSSFWETLILNMITNTVSFAINRKRDKLSEEQDIMTEIEKLEEVVQSKPSQQSIVNLEIAKEKLEQIRRHKVECMV